MNRKNFIRHTLLGFASLLLPEVLRPIDGEVKEEKYETHIVWEAGDFIYDYNRLVKFEPRSDGRWKVYLRPKN
jgi:hypothetical protein